ncbi:MAG TPA: IS1595 family transposase [Puia sp.]|jgi:hypothetical protein|nr:IS1595 family transposase [Puia sp.]
MFEGLSAIDFARKFPDNESCYKYLIGLKWGKGFTCRNCGCKQSIKGRTYYYKRCKDCKRDESVTSNSIFHDMKMPLLKAFYMVFRISTKKKGMSTLELGMEVKVQQKTAWLLKRKLQVVMGDPYYKKQLQGEVCVDETLIGGGRPGSYGRKHEEKEIALIAVERLAQNKTGNIALKHIGDFKYTSIAPAIEEAIDSKAVLYVDDFPTYRAVKKKRNNTVIVRSKGNMFYDELHKQVMMFKIWLTGIHHKCSKQHLHAYAAEYEFRFNRRNQRQWIFHTLLNGIFKVKPHPYKTMVLLCERST